MPNRLAGESSPYLLQHAHNPVDWHPWGEEALARAQAEDKPIFLSIGYSACHWCHVMERESFENPEIAAALNADFISIKVDREERPELDQIYMHAVQLISRGGGGWPLSAFLTPEQRPFFGGTYWPPTARYGRPGFLDVVRSVARFWKEQRGQALEQAGEVTRILQQLGETEASGAELDVGLLTRAEAALERNFDFTHGGFGVRPKFPHPLDLRLLLRLWRRKPRAGVLQMVRLTLDKMAAGGIYDHLGGGFARYSVDERWLTPHFEKMLYDNALLAVAYLEAHLATGEPDYARVVRETLDYVLRDLGDPAGGFHSTEDADSEGEEGKFYLWSPDEVLAVLGPAAGERFCYVYDVTPAGNFEESGRSILNLPKTLAQCASLRGWDLEELQRELAESRAKLLAARAQRVRPGKDDKVLVSWNALLIEALALAAGPLREPRYREAATRAASFLVRELKRPDGRWAHSWRGGTARHAATLDDCAYLCNAFITLYEAGFEEPWIDEAVELAETLNKRFRDRAQGGFFFTADDHEPLIARAKDFQDSSTPSGNSAAALAFCRLGKLCGRTDYLTAVRETLRAGTSLLERAPAAAGNLLLALDFYLGPLHEIVVLGDPAAPPTADALADLRSRFLPHRVLACRPRDEAPDGSPNVEPIFVGKRPLGGAPTVYLCRDFSCQAPVSGPAAASELWDQLARGGSP